MSAFVPFTPAQRKAYGAKMRAARAAATATAKRTVSGYGAYKASKAPTYYKKYKKYQRQARQTKATNDPQTGGWLGDTLGAVGSALLPGIGGPLGKGLGTLIKSVTGFGDYQVKENSLIPEAGAPPSIVNSNVKSVIIRHREYLDDVVSSSVANTFQLQNYYINPGDRLTFPWLSQLADSFEHYRIRGMLFEYRSMSADALNSTNTALGQVIMATSYNAGLPNFSNKYEMENYEFGQSIKPSDSCIHPIECARSQSVLGDLYVRPFQDMPSDEDRRLYDFGNFQIATNGVQGTSVNLGELWVTYEIELFKPKVATEDALYIPYAYSGLAPGSNGVTQAIPFGTTALIEVGNNTLTMSKSNTAITLSNMSPGQYVMYITWQGAAAVYALTSASATWAYTNATSVSYAAYPGAYNTQADSFVVRLVFQVTAQNVDVVITPTFSTSPPSGGNLGIEVMQVPKNQ